MNTVYSNPRQSARRGRTVSYGRIVCVCVCVCNNFAALRREIRAVQALLLRIFQASYRHSDFNPASVPWFLINVSDLQITYLLTSIINWRGIWCYVREWVPSAEKCWSWKSAGLLLSSQCGSQSAHVHQASTRNKADCQPASTGTALSRRYS